MTASKGLVLLTALLAVGCARGGSDGAPASSGSVDTRDVDADTLRGKIAVVGSDPAPTVALRPQSGSAEVYLSGPARTSLARLSGLEVWVKGSLDSAGRRMDVQRFEVRSADGVSAVDGVLRIQDDRLVLMTSDGRRLQVQNPPEALRAHVGARVWISGPLDREPVAFGVIAPAS